MAYQITQTITDPGTAPARTDPDNFDSRADAFLAVLSTWGAAGTGDLNVLKTQMNALSTAVNGYSTDAAASEVAAEAAQAAAEAAEDAAEAAKVISVASANAAIWLVGTTYAAGDVVLDPSNVYMSYISQQAANTGNTPSSDGGTWWVRITNSVQGNKNVIINGDFSISQRGTSFTGATVPLNSDDTFLLDRWILLSDGNDIVDVTQQSSGGVSGNENYIRLDVETAQKKFGILQVIENKNCKSLIGETASLSFEAKVTDITKLTDIRAAVVSWSSTADTVTSDIVATWEAEGTIPVLAANWTAENVAADLGVTASWVKYSINGISIDTASTANVGVFIYSNDVATNDTAGIFLEITNVQLEKSSVATDFEYRQIGDELARCQRYYFRVTAGGVNDPFFIGMALNTDTGDGIFYYPIQMRTVPSSMETSGTPTDYQVKVSGGAYHALDTTVPAIQSATELASGIRITATGHLTSLAAFTLSAVNSSAYIGFNAEL